MVRPGGWKDRDPLAGGGRREEVGVPRGGGFSAGLRGQRGRKTGAMGHFRVKGMGFEVALTYPGKLVLE